MRRRGVENGAGHIIENGDEIRLYYHQDLRGTVDYLTSPVSGKVESWTHYNEWGEITHNAVLKCGQRELDLVKNYTGHEYDAVLGMYYAKARFYDAENQRFISMDPVKGNILFPISLVQYIYVENNPLIYIDATGLTIYIDTIDNEDMTIHDKDDTGRPTQIFRDNRNYVAVRELIETLGGSVNYQYNSDGTYRVEYSIKNSEGKNVEGYFEDIGCYAEGTEYFGENGRTYIQVRAFAEKLGYGDVISYWNVEGQDVTEVLIQREMVNDGIVVTREGDTLLVKAYIKFEGNAKDSVIGNSGITYAEAAAMGIKQYWNVTQTKTEFDDFGIYNSMHIKVEIYSPAPSSNDAWIKSEEEDSRRYLSFRINDEQKRSNTGRMTITKSEPYKIPVFREENYINGFTYNPYRGVNGTIEYKKYTLGDFQWMAAHEFGHSLGLRDAYQDNSKLSYNEEVKYRSIMASQGGVVTANDIEMLMLARALNDMQSYFDETFKIGSKTYSHPKSSAISTSVSP